jgi:hypothetical protein
MSQGTFGGKFLWFSLLSATKVRYWRSWDLQQTAFKAFMELLVNDGHADIVIHGLVHGLVFGQDVVPVQDYRNGGDAAFNHRAFGKFEHESRKRSGLTSANPKVALWPDPMYEGSCEQPVRLGPCAGILQASHLN